jgi:hypothetical protein
MLTTIMFVALTTTFYYLGSRALITQPLWSRYSSRVATFMDCPACAGFWYGLVLAIAFGWLKDIAPLGLDPHAIETPVIVGLSSLFWTPVGAAVLHKAIEVNGSAV